jgi:hypothetical protein
LRAIEQDQYCLRQEYPERKKLRVVFWMAWYVFTSLLNLPRKQFVPMELVNFTDQGEEG